MNIRSFILLALTLCIGVTVASCGGSAGLAGGQEREALATADNPQVTELIAGAGQGWPATGEDVGEVSVWNDGTNLYVKMDTNGGWYFGGEGSDSLHLYVGDTAPTTTAPGQFPFKSGDVSGGNAYTFTLPLVDGNHDWTGDNLYVAAHGVTCIEEGGSGGDPVPQQGLFETMGIWMGNTNIDIGDATFTIDGTDLVINVSINAGYGMTAIHIYLDPTTPPTLPFGSWEYVNSSLPMVNSFEYRIPLADVPAWCEDNVFVGLHVHVEPDGSIGGLGGGSATTWNADCAQALLNPNTGRPHQFFKYCDFTVPMCEVIGGEERCETAWGLDPINGYDGISENEPGWFPTFFNDPTYKWGWVLRYQVTQ